MKQKTEKILAIFYLTLMAALVAGIGYFVYEMKLGIAAFFILVILVFLIGLRPRIRGVSLLILMFEAVMILMDKKKDGEEENSCPESKKLPAYVMGKISGAKKEKLDLHLQACASCRADIVELKKIKETM